LTQIFSHRIPSIRLGEFDLGGVLYHANYYHLYEQAREALLDLEGLPYHALVSDGAHLAIVESGQRFLAPVRYGDALELQLSFRDQAPASVVAEYRLLPVGQNDAAVVHEGWTRLVFVKIQNGSFKASRFPEKLVEILSKYGAARSRS